MFLVARSVPYKQMGKQKKWRRHAAWKSSVDTGRWAQVPAGTEQGGGLVYLLQKPLVHVTFWLLLNDTPHPGLERWSRG